MKDIRKIFFFNSLIVYAMTIIVIIMLIFLFLQSKNIIAESREYIYVLAHSGEIIPTKLAELHENRIIEAKHHVKMFVQYYFEINQNNLQENLRKALYLGDLKADHDLRTRTKYYERILAYSLSFRANIIDLEVTQSDDDEFQFSGQVLISTSGEGITSEEYIEQISGVLVSTDRNFPFNPHGFMIKDYVCVRKIIDK